MIKVDLITGFLGSGKTTFIKKYVKYLMDKGEKICVIENDFGAINIDAILVNEIGCDVEVIAGACDLDCHKRRFKTKLIAAKMSGHTRVIIEPSGIFDPDEFFDILYEQPLTDWYEIGNIFTIYDINTSNLSYESRYILCAELSYSSKIIITKSKVNQELDINYLNSILKEFKSKKEITNSNIIYFNDINFDEIINSGYEINEHLKLQTISENSYSSYYVLDKKLTLEKIKEISNILFTNNLYGNIIRIKGFILENNNWIKINLTKNDKEISSSLDGQDVIIVIGESLNEKLIEDLLK